MAALAAERAEHEGESAALALALHEGLRAAFDGDDGQLTQKMTFQEFSDKFKNDKSFLMKVSCATLIDYHELKMLEDGSGTIDFSILPFFRDGSGTIDFDEFVQGLVCTFDAFNRNPTEE